MHDRTYRYPESAYSVEIAPELCTDGSSVYFARHPEIPGCEAHGATPAEARQNLAEVWEMVMEHLEEFSLPIPEPQQRPSIEVRSFDLHKLQEFQRHYTVMSFNVLPSVRFTSLTDDSKKQLLTPGAA